MTRRLICIFNIAFLIGKAAVALECDTTIIGSDLYEGILGDDGFQFPWLGIMKIHLDDTPLRVALTGVVMVKERYAVASAQDLAQIPYKVFKRNSTAMFTRRSGSPWHWQPSGYLLHPEYADHPNTIALIKLAGGEKAPFKPVCLPVSPFNASQELFTIGYTDENSRMQQMIHKLKYVRLSLCEQFYEMKGLSDKNLIPVHYHCAIGANFSQDCIWESGMALASNYSGKWTLVGLSTRGLGCAAPSRYLDLHPYVAWIEAETSGDYTGGRKAGFEGHLRSGDTGGAGATRQAVPISRFFIPYDVVQKFPRIPFVIDRIDDDALQIYTFKEQYELQDYDCARFKVLAYREKFRVVDRLHREGKATYRISMYDLAIGKYTCIKVKIEPKDRSYVTLWYKLIFDNEDLGSAESEALNPFVREYPYDTKLPPATEHPPVDTEPYPWRWRPSLSKNLQARPVIAPYTSYRNFTNLNLLLWFNFSSYAFMDIQVYGTLSPPRRKATTTTTTPTPKTTTTTLWTWPTPYPTRRPRGRYYTLHRRQFEPPLGRNFFATTPLRFGRPNPELPNATYKWNKTRGTPSGGTAEWERYIGKGKNGAIPRLTRPRDRWRGMKTTRPNTTEPMRPATQSGRNAGRVRPPRPSHKRPTAGSKLEKWRSPKWPNAPNKGFASDRRQKASIRKAERLALASRR